MTNAAVKPSAQTGAALLVKSLEAQGVEYIFGVPEAKIDKVFDTLLDSNIKTVVCRHEQNAAFIASGIGRMTGRAGVALVTSGPGCSNLVTGLATATSEGDPVVAIGGAVPAADRLKQIHQSMDTVNLIRPVTKFSAEIDSAESVSEVVANAFRSAESGRPGAAFISAPKDIMMGSADGEVLTPATHASLGLANADATAAAAHLIGSAQHPVLLLGLLASEKNAAASIRGLLARTKLPVVCTYQGAGVVPRELFDRFGGRVGLFHTQPAGKLLDAADMVVAVGYDPIEYEPALWNRGKKRNLIHVDVIPADIDKDYRPQVELTGNIAATIEGLTSQLKSEIPAATDNAILDEIARDRAIFGERAAALNGIPIHPMHLVHELQKLLSDDMTLCLYGIVSYLAGSTSLQLPRPADIDD